MNVERKNTEIRDQAHEMWAEGTCDEQPSMIEIESLLKSESFTASNIDFWFDRMQGFWRWNCDISPIT